MVLTDAIAVIKPEPWRVQCFDCGHTVDKQAIFRHNAQRHWNEEARCVSGKVVLAHGRI